MCETWTVPFLSPLQGGFPSGLDSVRGTRHHGLVERVHRDRNRINSPHRRPLDKHGRQISFQAWMAGSRRCHQYMCVMQQMSSSSWQVNWQWVSGCCGFNAFFNGLCLWCALMWRHQCRQLFCSLRNRISHYANLKCDAETLCITFA